MATNNDYEAQGFGEIHKRSVSDIIFGTVVTNFIMSIFEPIVLWSDYHRITKLEDFQQHQVAKLQEFNQKLNMTKAVQSGMLELIKNNAHSIREQNRQLTHLTYLSSELTWVS